MKIIPTVPAEDILELQPAKPYIKKLIKAGLGLLKKYFGTEIVLEVPYNLQDIDPELLSAMTVGSKIGLEGAIKNEKKKKLPDEPFIYKYQSIVNQRSGSGGADFFSESAAYWKSLAEGIERYLWRNSDYFYKNRIKRASYEELGNEALDIYSLAGFSDKQKREIPILSFNEKTNFGWIKTSSLTARKKFFCPVQLFSSRYFKENVKSLENSDKTEPMLRWIITTGLATGKNLEEAINKGVLEIIERDAFMIAYLNKLSPLQFDLGDLSEQDESIRKILRTLKRYRLKVHLLKMPTDFPVNITLSIVIDLAGEPAISVGARADFNLRKSIIDALEESLSVRIDVKNSLAMDLEGTVDLEKTGRLNRLIYWSKHQYLPEIEFMIRGKKTKADLNKEKNFFDIQSSLPKKYHAKRLAYLIKFLRKKRYDLFYAELTTKEVRKFGLRCVKAVIPQLQPMHLDERIPYLDGKRLKEVPKITGYSAAEELNKVPHPFP